MWFSTTHPRPQKKTPAIQQSHWGFRSIRIYVQLWHYSQNLSQTPISDLLFHVSANFHITTFPGRASCNLLIHPQSVSTSKSTKTLLWCKGKCCNNSHDHPSASLPEPRCSSSHSQHPRLVVLGVRHRDAPQPRKNWAHDFSFFKVSWQCNPRTGLWSSLACVSIPLTKVSRLMLIHMESTQRSKAFGELWRASLTEAFHFPDFFPRKPRAGTFRGEEQAPLTCSRHPSHSCLAHRSAVSFSRNPAAPLTLSWL